MLKYKVMQVLGVMSLFGSLAIEPASIKQTAISGLIVLIALGVTIIGWKGEAYEKAMRSRGSRRDHDASYPSCLRRGA